MAEDMGITPPIQAQLAADYDKVMATVYAQVLANKQFSWQQLWNGQSKPDEKNGCCTGPLVSKGSCAASLRSLCDAASPAQTRFMTYAFSPGRCQGDPGNLESPEQDIANFLLVRGPYAVMGHGWCVARSAAGAPPRGLPAPADTSHFFSCLRPPPPPFSPRRLGCSRDYQVPDLLNADFGEPVDAVCKETAPGSQIFTRAWSKADVEMDCNTWTPTITFK